MMHPTMKDGLRFISTLTFRKLFNYFLLRSSFILSRLLRKPVHRGMPVSISVEPTTSCNLSCPECPSGLRQFSRPQGKIDPDLYEDIIEQLKSNLTYLLLYFQGEPMMVPGFFKLVEYARQNNIYTATSTNGHFLDEENARQIVESGLDRLIVSIDGTDQSTYEQYRKGGDLEKVKAGVSNLVRWKKELRSSNPFIIIQFLVFKNNEHQIPGIRQMARELQADRLELKSAQVYDYQNDVELIPSNPKYARYIKGKDDLWQLKKPIRNRCSRMWSGAVLTWDGRVVPCCFDKDASHQMGSLEDSGFKEIWQSRNYKEFREKILKNRSQIDICRNCIE